MSFGDQSWGFGAKPPYFSGPSQVRKWSPSARVFWVERIEGHPQLLIHRLQCVFLPLINTNVKSSLNTDLIICHRINFVVSSSLCLSQSKSNHKITRSARFKLGRCIFLHVVKVVIVLFQTMLKHINNVVTFSDLILD